MTSPTPPRGRYTLLGPDGQPHRSDTPGTLGGYRPGRRYGRLDCPAARRAIARGGYVEHRVFFADEQGGGRGRVSAVRRLPARAVCAVESHFTSVFAFHFTRAGSTSSRIFV